MFIIRLVVRVSCHLASCHTCTCHYIVITNIIVNYASHAGKTLLNVKRVRTHVLQDLVEIRIMLTRDKKWLMYTLHKSMKYSKYYFLVFLKARQCPSLSVKCSKLKCMFVLHVNVDRYCMHKLHSNAETIHIGRIASVLAIRLHKFSRVISTAVPEVYTDRMRFVKNDYSFVQFLCFLAGFGRFAAPPIWTAVKYTCYEDAMLTSPLDTTLNPLRTQIVLNDY